MLTLRVITMAKIRSISFSVWIEGTLYRQSLTNENDSIYLNESRIKILLDIE